MACNLPVKEKCRKVNNGKYISVTASVFDIPPIIAFTLIYCIDNREGIALCEIL